MKNLIIIVTIVLIVWFLFWKLPVKGIHYQTSSGNQTGYISSVEKEGIIWKTNRVYVKPTLESTQEDVYCVIDDNLYEMLSEKSQNKENITVTHISYLSAGLKHCSGEDAIITGLR